jgi:hypothetical protein
VPIFPQSSADEKEFLLRKTGLTTLFLTPDNLPEIVTKIVERAPGYTNISKLVVLDDVNLPQQTIDNYLTPNERNLTYFFKY